MGVSLIVAGRGSRVAGRGSRVSSRVPRVLKKSRVFKRLHYIDNSLHLARKYARIFVRGHYLFREANSFPRATLED